MWSLLIGVFFLIGGATGHMALKGTQSSGALAVVGVVLVAVGIYQMTTAAKPGGTGRQPGRPRTRRVPRRP